MDRMPGDASSSYPEYPADPVGSSLPPKVGLAASLCGNRSSRQLSCVMPALGGAEAEKRHRRKQVMVFPVSFLASYYTLAAFLIGHLRLLRGELEQDAE